MKLQFSRIWWNSCDVETLVFLSFVISRQLRLLPESKVAVPFGVNGLSLMSSYRWKKLGNFKWQWGTVFFVLFMTIFLLEYRAVNTFVDQLESSPPNLSSQHVRLATINLWNFENNWESRFEKIVKMVKIFMLTSR